MQASWKEKQARGAIPLSDNIDIDVKNTKK